VKNILALEGDEVLAQAAKAPMGGSFLHYLASQGDQIGFVLPGEDWLPMTSGESIQEGLEAILGKPLEKPRSSSIERVCIRTVTAISASVFSCPLANKMAWALFHLVAECLPLSKISLNRLLSCL
jgi:hypothetical protein